MGKDKPRAATAPGPASPASTGQAASSVTNAKPTDTTLSDAKPTDATLSDAKPTDTSLSDAKPTDTTPAIAELTDTTPSDAEPTDTSLSDAKPTDASSNSVCDDGSVSDVNAVEEASGPLGAFSAGKDEKLNSSDPRHAFSSPFIDATDTQDEPMSPKVKNEAHVTSADEKKRLEQIAAQEAKEEQERQDKIKMREDAKAKVAKAKENRTAELERQDIDSGFPVSILPGANYNEEAASEPEAGAPESCGSSVLNAFESRQDTETSESLPFAFPDSRTPKSNSIPKQEETDDTSSVLNAFG